MKVTVTQEDIEAAKVARASMHLRHRSCPIAQSMMRMGYLFPEVYILGATGYKDGEFLIYTLSRSARRFVRRADKTQDDVEPAAFVLHGI